MRLDSFDPRRWPVWQVPGPVLGAVLTVELAAVLLVARSVLFSGPPGVEAWQFAATILGLGLVQAEVVAGVERVRRRIGEALHVDLSSVWTFAAALLLPSVQAVGIAVVLQLHLWRRSWYPRVPLYRHVFSIATIGLACLAAGGVARLTRPGDPAALGEMGLGTIVLALLTYAVVNSALVGGAIIMSSPQPEVAAAIGKWDDNALEFAMLSLGALTAVGLVVNPFLAVFALPAVLLLHRAVLVRHLEQAVNTDDKTGLLTAAAWHTRATRELERAGTAPSAVLVMDLDHFKDVNDHHGHIAGDLVLSAVADSLRAEVRDHDLVGRFGGEEFVVLLAGVDGAAGDGVLAIADRIRAHIASLRVEIPTPDGPLTVAGLTVSIGAAVHPGHGEDVGTLMQSADAALYAAKRAGRNTVRLAASPPTDALAPDSPS